MCNEIIVGALTLMGVVVGSIGTWLIEMQKQKHDDRVYTSKARYDSKLSKYQELATYSCDASFSFGAFLNCLYKDDKPGKNAILKKAITSFNNFNNAVQEYSVCIDESIYQEYRVTLNLFRRTLILFEGWCSGNELLQIDDPITGFSATSVNRETLKEQIVTSLKSINDKLDGIRIKIRSHLNELEIDLETK